MSTTPALEEQISAAGLTYGRRHDISYRTGLVLQALGAGLLAVLYPLESPFYTAGIMLFELGVLLSAVSLLARMRPIKKFIASSVVVGLALQVAGSFFAPREYAGEMIIGGIGFVCTGASGIAAKEAYSFGYREGWLLALVAFPVMTFVNLFGRENIVFNSLGFSILFLLLLSLTGRKLKQPVLSKCGTNVCGTPKASTQS